MFYYAQLNDSSICVFIATSSNPIVQPNMIQLPFDDQDKMYRMYKNGKWSTEKYPDGYIKTSYEVLMDRYGYLNTERDKEIYGTFTFEGNLFDCDKFARENINDFCSAFELNPEFEGMPWYTSGGANLIFLEGRKAPMLRAGALDVKVKAFAEFNRLDGQLRQIDLSKPNAIDLINAVVWRKD